MAEYSLGEFIVNVGAVIDGFTDAMSQVSDRLANVGDLGDQFASRMEGALFKTAAAVGVTLGVFDTLKASLADFSREQDVLTSFTVLTGSAGMAQAAFNGLRQTAQDLALPFQEVLSTAQRLQTVFPVGSNQMQQVLQAAADAAAATGTNFETVASSIERIGLTGQVSTRQMMQLQISVADIAKTMGWTIQETMERLKQGGQSAAADVEAVTKTLEARFGGAAVAIADNLSGTFTRLKNLLGDAYSDMGEALNSAAKLAMSAFEKMIPDLKIGLVGTIQLVEDGIGRVSKAVEAISGSSIGTIISRLLLGFGGLIDLIGAAVRAIFVTLQDLGGLIYDIVTRNWSKLKTDAAIAALDMKEAWVKNLQAVIEKSAEAQGKISTLGGGAGSGEGYQNSNPMFGPGGSKDLSGEANALKETADAAARLGVQKKLLSEATKDQHSADAEAAEYLRATFIPIIKNVEDAEADVAATFNTYTAAHNAQQATRLQIDAAVASGSGNLAALEAKYADQEKVTANTHQAYNEALKDQALAKSTLATATQAITSGEDAIASSMRSLYTPALLDHATALENVAYREQDVKDAQDLVRDAQVKLGEVYDKATSGEIAKADAAKAIQDAEDKLAATKKNLTTTVENLNGARKEETSSMALLNSAAKDVIAGQLDALASSKLLYGATTDIATANENLDEALQKAKDAADNEAAALLALNEALKSGDPKAITEAQLEFNAARRDGAAATKTFTDAQQVIQSSFGASAEVMRLITQRTNEWGPATKEAQERISGLGITSSQVFLDIKAKADAAWAAIQNDPFASTHDKLVTYQRDLQQTIQAGDALGQNTDSYKMKLIAVQDQLRITEGFLLSFDRALHSLSISLTNSIGQGVGKLAFSLFDSSANDALDNQMKSLRDALATESSSYAATVASIKQQMADLTASSAEELAKQLADLTASIDDKKLQYDRDTEDLNASYQKQVEDLRNTIAEKELDYTHWVEQQQLKLQQLEGDNSASAQHQREDIQLSLRQRAEDMTLFRSEEKQKQADADAAYKTSVERQAQDYAASVAEIKAKQVEVTAAAKAQLDTQTANLQKQLDDATAKFEKYKTDNAAQLQALQSQHQTALGKIGDMFAGVFKKAGEDLAAFVTEFLVGKLFKQLDFLTDKLSGIGKLFTSAFSGGGNGLSIPMSTWPSGGSPVGNFDESGIPIPGGSGAAGAAGSAISSSLSSVFGMVTGAISAVTGVVGIFQAAQSEHTMNAVESNTRVSAIHLGHILEWIQDIQHFNYDSLFPELAGINTMLMDFVNGSGPMGAALIALGSPKVDYSEYNATTLGQSGATLSEILDTLQGQVHNDMVIIEGKLDTLNQSVVVSGGNSTGTFSVNGVTQTVTRVGQPIQMVSNDAKPAPTWNDVQNGLAAAAPWQSFVDALSENTTRLNLNLDKIFTKIVDTNGWLDHINAGLNTANSWLAALTTDVLNGFAGLNSAIVPKLDQMVQYMAGTPPVQITIQGNVIGNAEFVQEVADAVAAQIRAQGAYA